jgi:GNAT superfamily N-acetyltransferase
MVPQKLKERIDEARVALRVAEPDDVDLILEFIEGRAEYEATGHQVEADVGQLRETLFGERRFAEVLIAEYDGVPAGFVLYYHNYSTYLGKPGLKVEDIYVRPEYRGKGIGTKLFTHLATIAIDRGCGRFEWWVLDWNAPAISFYEKLGAKAMDEWMVFRVPCEKLKKLVAES